MSVFETLNSVNVNDRIEKKNGLSYLSWAWAWAEVKKAYPGSSYTIYESPQGCFYWTDGRTCWVKTGVTIEGLEHIEYLPVMDHRNNSIPLEKVTSTDVNRAIQRSITKACARHGLGLYIYAGEDLPDGDESKEAAKAAVDNAQPVQASPEAEKLAARAMCQRAVRSYCQSHSADEKEAWKIIADSIGKPSKDFTIDDWRAGEQIAKGWGA